MRSAGPGPDSRPRTRPGPTVFVVEDLHWASAQLLDMLERLVARSEGPLGVICTARPEFAEKRPGFGGGTEEFSSVSLRPLTQEQSVELVEGLLAEADLPDGLRGEILSKAEGNPFFLEEMLRRLIDEGAIVREANRWTAPETATAVVLPETVQGVLASRIHALDPEQKAVLQEAAVVGRAFWAEPVERAIGDGGVSGALRELERKGLIFARPTSGLAGQVEYMFKHALVRDVAYASLPKARRARAHADHAAWIEERSGERAAEFADVIAYHYEAAVSGEDADLAWAGDQASLWALKARGFQALMRAGSVARQRFALDRAAELHQHAVDLAPTDSDRAQALEELGIDHDTAYHGEPGFEAYLKALEIVRAGGGTDADRARLCWRAAALAVKGGPFHELVDPAVIEPLVNDGLEAAGDTETRARLLALRGEVGSILDNWGRPDPMGLEARIRAAEEAWQIAESVNSADLSSAVITALEEVLFLAQEYERSAEATLRRLEFVDRLASPMQKAEDLHLVAFTLLYLGRYEEALQLARRSYELGRDMSAHARMHGTFVLMAYAVCTGEWSELPPLID